MLGCRRIRVTKARVMESAEEETAVVGVGETASDVGGTDAEVGEAKSVVMVIAVTVTGGHVDRRGGADCRGRRLTRSLGDPGACR